MPDVQSIATVPWSPARWPALATPPARALLTVREADIARLVGRGLSSKLIGAQLGISEHTVRKHRENIARKLHLRNAAELVAWSIRQLEPAYTA